MELEVSRKEVGMKVGASVFAVRNWENNISSPNRRYHTAITVFLGYDPEVRRREFYGDRILSYLKAQGVSRTQLASRLGVTPQTLHKWIHDMSTPPERLLAKLLCVIGSHPTSEKEPK